MARYNTNLASEFHVLSALFRLGVDAYLTLGDKKSVDIVAVGSDGNCIDIEVKGVAGKHQWTVGDLVGRTGFLVLVSFDGRIDDPRIAPSCWVLTMRNARMLTECYKSRTNIKRSSLREVHRDAWNKIAIAAGVDLA